MKTKTKMSELVKDPEWQKIRESLLGQWKKRPAWCCKQLENYAQPLKSATNKQLVILMNYLTGTGFRMGKISHPCITDLRKRISLEISARKING